MNISIDEEEKTAEFTFVHKVAPKFKPATAAHPEGITEYWVEIPKEIHGFVWYSDFYVDPTFKPEDPSLFRTTIVLDASAMNVQEDDLKKLVLFAEQRIKTFFSEEL